jgi:hypothetical protein
MPLTPTVRSTALRAGFQLSKSSSAKAKADFRGLSSSTNSTPASTSNEKTSGKTKSTENSEKGVSQLEGKEKEVKQRKLTMAEKDAELMAKLQGMDGGAGAVEEKEWNGLAKGVKDNMVSDRNLKSIQRRLDCPRMVTDSSGAVPSNLRYPSEMAGGVKKATTAFPIHEKASVFISILTNKKHETVRCV